MSHLVRIDTQVRDAAAVAAACAASQIARPDLRHVPALRSSRHGTRRPTA
jgi:hypothetical protein